MSVGTRRPEHPASEDAPACGTALRARWLGRRPYDAVWREMRAFTDCRGPETPDALWLLEHPPVFTLGQAARREHLRDPGDIAVVSTDRGGQVTYHGPGQLVAYALLDLRRRRLGVRELVGLLELAVIDLLASAGLRGERRAGAPGVYVAGRKLAALGLRVRRGCSYHGLALNVDLDPAPFARIDPCGYPGLPVCSLRDLGLDWDVRGAGERLHRALAARLRRDPAAPSAAAP